jgi:hypothetical protein|tara:strand:- start:148 stop:807 length:660 start_codon:yes stop_codon:yes gene_type:complete
MTTTKQQTTEEKKFEDNKTSCLNNNSLIPSLKECERFILFLNKKFKLNLPDDYLITINKTKKSTIGFFMPKQHEEHFTNTTQDLNNINLNTYYLKEFSPYEVLTHEIAHFLNNIKKIRDCSSNQYHNKHFKTQAEKLLLKVERTTNKGYSQTSETEDFKKMLKEFKPKDKVFNIFQNQKDKKKVGSRLKLYICECGVRVRVAGDDFKGLCLICRTKFKK